MSTNKVPFYKKIISITIKKDSFFYTIINKRFYKIDFDEISVYTVYTEAERRHSHAD